MRNLSKMYILAIFLVLICCLGAASAAEIDNSTTDSISAIGDVDEVSQDTALASAGEVIADDKLMDGESGEGNSSSNYVEIYVGQNTTDDGGNGSYENPYATLDLACANVNEGDNVTLNMFNGTYYVGSQLTFKSANLIINGLGNVIIKNGNDGRNIQALSISYKSANLTINNVIFDQSGVTQSVAKKFYPVYVDKANTDNYTVIFNNCSFIGSTHAGITGACEFNVKFIKCNFRNYGRGQNSILFSPGYFYNGKDARDTYYRFVYFENCVLILNVAYMVQRISPIKTVNLDGMWFGENVIPEYLINIQSTLPNGQYGDLMDIPVTKYAVFNVTENYLGDNKYEIIGTLCWNGTNVSVGDAFAPMTVTLTSASGDIQSNATLENGVFRAVYTSNSSDNKVTAKLDYETIDLNFVNVDFQVDAPSIFYGQDQNITITLPQATNSTLNVTVNNKTYEVKVNDSASVTFTVPEILKEGTYLVEVLLCDAENHIYGSNSTELVVSRVSDYAFAPIVPSDAKVGDIVTVVVELPSDATGTVTVYVGETPFTGEASANVEINITGLVAGDNNVKVVYSGDDKYVNKSSESVITAEKITIEITNNTAIANVPAGTTAPTFTITLPRDATGNITVDINNKKYTQELVNGSATVKVAELNPGKYPATITYTGDAKYNQLTTNATVSVPKPVLAAKNVVMLYTSASKYTVRVTLGGKAVSGKLVTFIINGKKLTAKTNANGYASVNLNLPPKNTVYTVSASYLGVKVTNKVAVKSIVVAKNVIAKKSAKFLRITVSLKKVNNKFLSAKNVVLRFNGKNYIAKTNNKGVATFTINKNVLSKLKVGKQYVYRVTYGKDIVNRKVIVRK